MAPSGALTLRDVQQSLLPEHAPGLRSQSKSLWAVIAIMELSSSIDNMWSKVKWFAKAGCMSVWGRMIDGLPAFIKASAHERSPDWQQALCTRAAPAHARTSETVFKAFATAFHHATADQPTF
jgi:hypothetical protein